MVQKKVHENKSERPFISTTLISSKSCGNWITKKKNKKKNERQILVLVMEITSKRVV